MDGSPPVPRDAHVATVLDDTKAWTLLATQPFTALPLCQPYMLAVLLDPHVTSDINSWWQ